MQALRSSPDAQGAARVIMHPATMQYHQEPTGFGSKIVLPMRNTTRLVRADDILYCKAESNYCHVILKSGERILISKTLKWMEGNVPGTRFVRAHASYLVNMDKVSLHSHDILELEGGNCIPVSRSRGAEVRKRLINCVSGSF